MIITIRLRNSVSNLQELSRTIAAFETVDEVFRLIKIRDQLRPQTRIDFRTKRLKDTKGGKLSGFNVSSPPSITVEADNLWIGAFLYILKDYRNLKANLIEMGQDSNYLSQVIASLTEDQLMEIEIGVKLFAEQIAEIGEGNMKWLTMKLQSAEKTLHPGNIDFVDIDQDDGT